MLAVVEYKKDGLTHAAAAAMLDDSPEGYRYVGNPMGMIYDPKTGTDELGGITIQFYKGVCRVTEKGSPVVVEYKKIR